MKKRHLITLFALAVLLFGCTSKTEKLVEQVIPENIDTEFCLITSEGKIYELNSEMPFVNIKPTNVESGSGDGFKWEIYTYPTIEIKALISDDGKKYINKITTTSSGFKTPRGIEIGDDEGKLLEAYNGEDLKISYLGRTPGYFGYMYDPEDDIGFNKIFFDFENSKIERITIENCIDG